MNDINENNKADHILVDRVLSGDTNAFSFIISNTERLVTQIIFKMIANNEDKKDIAQDIYLKTFHKLESFKFQSKLSTWVAQIAYNTCLNYLEKKKLVLLSNFHADNETDNELLYNPKIESEYYDAESVFFKNELAQILKIETDKLPPLYKTLVTLYHNEELSYAEIAQITELPEGTLKSYLFRARKTLRDNLLKNYKKEEL
ncbi:MAG: sigma-70 family RNA polymerase sigma factor [Ferruginibacter sp.]